MTLAKEQVQEKIKELYVFNASLDEEEVKKKRKKLYREITTYYSNWDRALLSCGISKRKLREREKFTLYFLLKGRLEKYGPEAIRPKNVQPLEVKERIVNSFKTLKALRDIVIQWNEDKVLYELHAAFLTGAEVDEIEKTYPELYEHMMDHFKDIKDVLEQYNKRFGLPSIAPEQVLAQLEEEEQEPHEMLAKNDDLIDMMIKLNYIDKEEDAEAIIQANRLGKETVIAYLFEALSRAQKSGVKITEQGMREEEPAIYFAMKAHYKNLENAFKEMTKTLVEMK